MSLLNLGNYPVALLLIGLLIPLVYSAARKRKQLRSMALLYACGILIVVLYPLTGYLSGVIGQVGYPLGKLLLFVLLPIVVISYIERWKLGEILYQAGVRRENLTRSVIYGLGAAVITIAITLYVSPAVAIDIAWSVITFFESQGILMGIIAYKTKNIIGPWIGHGLNRVIPPLIRALSLA